MSAWILVKDELPKEGGWYLVCDSFDAIYIAEYDPQFTELFWKNVLCVGCLLLTPVAWMPLPKPYGKETENDYFPISDD